MSRGSEGGSALGRKEGRAAATRSLSMGVSYRLLRRPVKGNHCVFFPADISACYLNRSCSSQSGPASFSLSTHTLPVQWHFGASVVGRRAFFPSGDNLSFGSSFLSPPFSLTRNLLPFNPRSRGTDGRRPRRSQCGAGVSYKCSRRSEQARARGLRGPPSMTFARVRVGGRLSC